MDDPQRRGAVAHWIRTVGDPWIKSEHPPVTGSALAGDDRVRPAVSELARFGIATAIDHLGLVVDAMDSDLPFRHYGPLTALRTTLLAAARTQWLLKPAGRPERRFRACRIEFENLTQQRIATNALTGNQMSSDLVDARDALIALLDNEIHELEGRASAVRPRANLSRPDDTASIIRTLVDEHTDEGQAIRHLWRTGSAAAHGFHWANLGSGKFDETWFNTSLYASMMMVQETLELYGDRAASHLGRA
jgi:hypothetical protein